MPVNNNLLQHVNYNPAHYIVISVTSGVIMPDFDGYELAHTIHYKYPHIKVQLCSGFSMTRGKTVTDETLFKNLLYKPFTNIELFQKVKKLLID